MRNIPLAMAEGAMSAFLGEVTTFFTTALTWMGQVMTTVMDNPLLLTFVAAMPIAGYGVGLLRRIIGL